MMNLLEVKKARTTPYHPESDGLVERLNRTVKDILWKIVNEKQNDWKTWLPSVMLAYRTSVHSSTTITPYRMMFGKRHVYLSI